jgi:hypothetical protein
MSEAIDDVLDWQLLPSPPGYVLWWVSDAKGEADPLFGPAPIIGWIIERRKVNDGKRFYWDHRPITAEDVDLMGTEDYAIQFPDGRVYIVEDCTVDTIDAARAHLRKRS